MSAIKFVSDEKIPARLGHGVRKYEDLYEGLQKKPGKWAEITQSMKYTLSHRDGGKKTYSGVKTMKRGDRYFASFQKDAAKPAKLAKPAKTTRKAKTPRRSRKKGKRS